ncbi:hypothetical protein ARMGADRAFT_1093050 [Armillaria gallica]|uniref:Uncharacterized protein n=1 Tax=Armillaria gallica TaxID=47427 RepID=A0A2H3C8X6_ARMGA|nr:hypothetical protein ARMGADRAFT_1093050 [Armillaria gallica]
MTRWTYKMGDNKSTGQETLRHISAKPAVKPVLFAADEAMKTSSNNLGYVYQDRPGIAAKTSFPRRGNTPISGRLGQAELQAAISSALSLPSPSCITEINVRPLFHQQSVFQGHAFITTFECHPIETRLILIRLSVTAGDRSAPALDHREAENPTRLLITTAEPVST